MPQVTKRVTITDILLEHAENEYRERGDRFATEAEMRMYREDAGGMFGWRESQQIVAEYVASHISEFRALELAVWEE